MAQHSLKLFGIAILSWMVFSLCVQKAGAADPSRVYPPVHSIDRVERYVVTGANVAQINRQLRELAQRASVQGNARTQSRFELIRKLQPTDNGCVVLSLRVQIEFTTVLPEWLPERPVSAELREEWARSVELLERHEAGHRRNALQAAETLRRKLMAAEPQASCLTMDARMALELQSRLDHLDRVDTGYDRRTFHGLRDDPRLGGSTVAPTTVRQQRLTRPDWSVLELHR